jgi:aspartate 1-decarboxylase
MIEGEKVSIVNVNNGERLDTYAIKGEKGNGEITMNGPAARKVQTGDIIIIISYAQLDFEEAKTFKPTIIFPNESTNALN